MAALSVVFLLCAGFLHLFMGTETKKTGPIPRHSTDDENDIQATRTVEGNSVVNSSHGRLHKGDDIHLLLNLMSERMDKLSETVEHQTIRITSLETNVSTLQTVNSRLESQLLMSQETARKQAATIDTLKDEAHKRETKMYTLADAVADLQKDVSRLKRQQAATDTRVDTVNKDISKLENAVDKTNKKVTDLDQKSTKLRADVRALESKTQKLTEGVDNLQKADELIVHEANHLKTELDKKSNELKSDVKVLASWNARLSEDVVDLRKTDEKLSRDTAELKKEVSSISGWIGLFVLLVILGACGAGKQRNGQQQRERLTLTYSRPRW